LRLLLLLLLLLLLHYVLPQAASMSGSSPVCSRALPAATVEQLEAFFQGQLAQVGWLVTPM
jgi:hypothetical protein